MVALGSLTRSSTLSTKPFSSRGFAVSTCSLMILTVRDGNIAQKGERKLGDQQEGDGGLILHHLHSLELRGNPTLYFFSWARYLVRLWKLQFRIDSRYFDILSFSELCVFLRFKTQVLNICLECKPYYLCTNIGKWLIDVHHPCNWLSEIEFLSCFYLGYFQIALQ